MAFLKEYNKNTNEFTQTNIITKEQWIKHFKELHDTTEDKKRDKHDSNINLKEKWKMGTKITHETEENLRNEKIEPELRTSAYKYDEKNNDGTSHALQ